MGNDKSGNLLKTKNGLINKDKVDKKTKSLNGRNSIKPPNKT